MCGLGYGKNVREVDLAVDVSRRTRLHGLRQHGNRRLFAGFAILCVQFNST